MKIIKLDAAHWKSVHDFYDAILPALGAPEWHGRSVNALVESMIWGEINALEPPYVVEISSTKGLPADVLERLTWTEDEARRARAEFALRQGHDVDVTFKLMD